MWWASRAITLLLTCTLFVPFFVANADVNEAIPGDYNAPGFSDLRDYQGGLTGESVDPFTGALKILQTDYVYPGTAGLDIVIQRYYSNLHITNESQSSEARSFIGIGWDLHFGRVWTYANTDTTLDDDCSGISNVKADLNPVLELQDGTRKVLFDRDSDVGLITKDFWRASCLTSSQISSEGMISGNGRAETVEVGLKVDAPNGVSYYFAHWGPNRYNQNAYLVSKIKDRYGNWLKFTYKDLEKNQSNETTYRVLTEITSNDNRKVVFNYENQTLGSVSSDDNPANLWLDSISIGSAKITYTPEDTPHEESTFTSKSIFFLKSADIDGELKHQYEYYEKESEFTDGGNRGLYSLKNVLTPGHAKTNYVYGGENITGNSGAQNFITVVKKKAVSGSVESATWTFDYDQNTIRDRTTVSHLKRCIEYIHDGSQSDKGQLWRRGNLRVKNTYSGASCSGTTNLIQKETYDWAPLPVSAQDEFRSFPPAYNSSTVTPVLTKKAIVRDGVTYTTEIKSRDFFGNVKEIVDYDSIEPSKKRTIHYTYFVDDNNYWILHQLADETIDGFGLSGIKKDIDRTYYANGQVKTEVIHGVEHGYTYHSNGELKSYTGPDGHKIEYNNYELGVAKLVTYESKKLTRGVDNRGNIDWEEIEKDGRKIKTTYDYDDLNRLTDINTPISGDNDINISYDAGTQGYKITKTRGSVGDGGPGSATIIEVQKFDGFGKIKSKSLSSGDKSIITSTTYNSLGQMDYVLAPGGFKTTYEFDVLGRVEKITNPDNSVIDTTYVSGKNQIKIEDEEKHTQTYHYDAYGDPDDRYLVKIEQPIDAVSGADGSMSVTTTIKKNILGFIEEVQQGELKQIYNYFSDRPTQLEIIDLPEIGEIKYTRDQRGNVKSKSINGAVVEYYGYDEFSKLTSKLYWGNSNKGGHLTFKYDIFEELSISETANTRWTYVRDDNGNLDTATVISGFIDTPLEFDYDYSKNDYLHSIQYPHGETIVYSPDELGRSTTVGAYISDIEYYDSGVVKSYRDAAGLVSTFSETARNDIDTHVVKLQQKELINLDYDYYKNRNLKTITDKFSVAKTSLSYDGVGRLYTTSGLWGSGKFIYDDVNNITSKTLSGNTSTYSYNPLSNRLESVSGVQSYTFQYDDWGSIRTDGQNHYEYSSDGRIHAAFDSTPYPTRYYYDANGRRVHSSHENALGLTEQFYAYGIGGNMLYSNFRFIDNQGGPHEEAAFANFYLGTKLVAERRVCTDVDNDSDGIPDCIERNIGMTVGVNDANDDFDDDGLTNIEEYRLQSMLFKSDTDEDGMPDSYEYVHSLKIIEDDASVDSDGDGLSNFEEYTIGTNPNKTDTDGDGVPDNEEHGSILDKNKIIVPVIHTIL